MPLALVLSLGELTDDAGFGRRVLDSGGHTPG